jgi:hypothetical protein
MMTSEERLELIDRLKREADEGRERIAALAAAREADPFRHEEPADQRITKDANDLLYTDAHEPVGSPHMRANVDARGLVYKTMETPLPAVPEPVLDISDGEPAVTAEAVGIALGDIAFEVKRQMQEEVAGELLKRDRRISELEGELRELKGFVSGILAALGPGPSDKSAGVVNLRRRRDGA